MDWDRVRRKLKLKWSLLTDADLKLLEFEKAEFLAKVMALAGLARNDVEREVDAVVGEKNSSTAFGVIYLGV